MTQSLAENKRKSTDDAAGRMRRMHTSSRSRAPATSILAARRSLLRVFFPQGIWIEQAARHKVQCSGQVPLGHDGQRLTAASAGNSLQRPVSGHAAHSKHNGGGLNALYALRGHVDAHQAPHLSMIQAYGSKHLVNGLTARPLTYQALL